MNYELLERKLIDFIQKQVQAAGLKGALLGLSGGVDSAVVATLLKRALNENCFALLMPTKFSNENNLKDALHLCEILNLKHEIIEIQGILDSFLKASFTQDKTRIGNFSARIRMSLLYDYSAKLDFLVAGTSNKTELTLGYGTIYGDLACAFNPIGELYKSDIYEFAKFLNLPEIFITKPASADLYEGQSDEAELGFSYAKIDTLLKARDSGESLASADKDLLKMIELRERQNAFKRRLPTIAIL